MIQLQHVHKKLDNKTVLSDINWKLTDGKVYGLVGPNGTGKSTLLRLISGVYQSDSGKVTVESLPVYENPAIKAKILFVSDDPFFAEQSTIEEMKEFYRLFYPEFSLELYQQLLDLFLINSTAKINTFSKGMKRQASLILALACRPKYLLLDEAFDGLDPVMRLALKQLISDELISRQLTVIISSHNIRELEDICDEITLIQNGTINLSGDIAMIRNAYHKYQLAFYEPASAEMFHAIPYIDLELNSKFVVIIVKSEIDITALEALCPLIMEELPMSLEEIFVYEMKEHGYGRNI